MATKVKKAAEKSVKTPTVKAAKKEAPKKETKAKSSTKSEDEEVTPVAASADGANPIDPDEVEDEAAAAASSNGGGNAAALAAAAGSSEMSASFKNFRHHPDMENFYRFIYENDLRHEALAIIDEMMREKLSKRNAKSGGKSAH